MSAQSTPCMKCEDPSIDATHTCETSYASTPGPWKVRLHEGTIQRAEVVTGDGSSNIATVYGILREDDPECMANARLIARAPALAAENEALHRERQAMLVALDAIANMEVTETTDHRQLTALVLAIAKQALAGAI